MRLTRDALILIALASLNACGCAEKTTGGVSSNSTAVDAGTQEASALPVPVQETTPISRLTEGERASKDETSSAEAQKPLPVTKEPEKPTPEQIAQWGLLESEPLKLLDCRDGFADPAVQSLAMSPDGKQFVLAGSKLTYWNTKDSQPFAELLVKYPGEEVKRPLRSVAISPDGAWLVAGEQKGKFRIWGLSDQHEEVAIQAHDAHLTVLAISPDSRLLATTSYSGEVKLWQFPSGKKLKSLKISDREITRLVFLSDTLLAAAGHDASIWNVESGEKQTTLTDKYVIGPALELSQDRRWLAFNDADSALRLWDVQKSELSIVALQGASAHLIDFSHDGKWIATYSQYSNIRIWDSATGRLIQVIDADGGRTSGLRWIRDCKALLVASEQGRVRIWGTIEAAGFIGFSPAELPVVEPTGGTAHRSMSSAQFQRVMDIRSFPRLPGAVPQWSDYGICSYTAPTSRQEAELFYRYILEKSGWTEVEPTTESAGGLVFQKEGCELTMSFSPVATEDGKLQISLQFAGNYDARWLPKFAPTDSKSSWESFSTVGYRTKGELTDVEVGLLKQFHEAGWTAYSRLAASTAEDPKSRTISMLQGGSVLTVAMGHPADSAEEVFVQTSISVTNKSLPIPPDAGWIEFDSSTEIQFVVNTKLNLEETAQFYDKQMAAEGWLSRESGRNFQDDKGWLPYIRGQQDIFLRLASLPGGGTRIVAGDAARSSWQLQKPADSSKTADKPGIEAADLRLPEGAKVVKFDLDDRKIDYELANSTPKELGEHFVKEMETHEWKREDAGVISDDYVFITFSKAKAEIQLRARAGVNQATAMISGDGLLWTKPLPTAPVRISYGTWLRRDHKDATLDLLDQFADEMHKIPDAEK